MTAAVEENSLP